MFGVDAGMICLCVLEPGTCLKSFLDVFRFALNRYGAEGTHGDPIQVKFNIFCVSGLGW